MAGLQTAGLRGTHGPVTVGPASRSLASADDRDEPSRPPNTVATDQQRSGRISGGEWRARARGPSRLELRCAGAALYELAGRRLDWIPHPTTGYSAGGKIALGRIGRARG